MVQISKALEVGKLGEYLQTATEKGNICHYYREDRFMTVGLNLTGPSSQDLHILADTGAEPEILAIFLKFSMQQKLKKRKGENLLNSLRSCIHGLGQS